MGRSSHSPIWPFLLIVSSLFLLSIFGPRQWERIARHEAMPNVVAPARARIARQTMPAAPPIETAKTKRPKAAPTPTLAPPAPVASAPAAPNSTVLAGSQRAEPPLAAVAESLAGNVPDATPQAVAAERSAAREKREETINAKLIYGAETAAAAPTGPITPRIAAVSQEPTPGTARQPALRFTRVLGPETEAPSDSAPVPTLVSKSESSQPIADVETQETVPDSAAPNSLAQTADGPATSEATLADAAADASADAAESGDAVVEDAPGEAEISDEPQAIASDDGSQGPRWAPPIDLLARLDALRAAAPCSAWADETHALVVELTSATCPSDERTTEIVTRLRTLSGAVDSMLPALPERQTAVELMRARHALTRRLDVWELIPELIAHPPAEITPDSAAVARLLAAITQLDDLTTAAGDEGAQWRRYLALDTLRAMAQSPDRVSPADARHVARQIDGRLHRAGLTEEQRKFITSPPVVELGAALRPWEWSAFDPVRLLADIERFEVETKPGDARRVADDFRQSALAATPTTELADRLEANYRNANIRIAISERLLKRLMPPLTSTTDPVRDQILGVPTRGTSTTSTAVDVKLVPDDRHLRVAIEASGSIFSNTRSTSGPATLHSHSDSRYHARKVIDLDIRGLATFPAEAECLDSHSRLRSVNTDFDGVPLVGSLVEGFARSRHADKEDEIRSIMRRKIETQARQKFDALTQERIDSVNRTLEDRLIEPLERMELDPQVISAETSDERLTMRLRLAGEEQLGGHTPRPRAPSDSLLSLQLHQSLFNNVLEQLQLNGRTFRLPDLREHIIKKLNLQGSRFMDDSEQDVSITFAADNAVRVRCDNGLIELTMSVARLANADHAWNDFTVRVYYHPKVDGLTASLERDTTVRLIGKRLSTRSQIALRSIFSKVFAKDRELVLVGPEWSEDERTRDLAFTQFVIQDGWLAAAVALPRDNIAVKRAPAAPR